MESYEIRASISYIEDSPEHIDFHIKSGDYLPYLATLMGFVEEALKKCACGDLSEAERTIARELRHDLRFVHTNYKVVPRELDDVRDALPGRNLLAE